jgi:DNA polymerase II large subunit
MADGSIKAKIAHELYEAVRKLDAKSDLLSIIGSYGDTLGDEEVLERLRLWNTAHEISHLAKASRPKASPPENS